MFQVVREDLKFHDSEQTVASAQTESSIQPFQEIHFPVRHWAERWGFSEKTVREWFRDENGSGILRLPHIGRRGKRDYTSLMISPSAAARVYYRRTRLELDREVM